MAKVNLMERDPTVSDHLANKGLGTMRKAMMPKEHSVFNLGISNHD